ncbi:MAG: Gfo/Idh/MocA family oxidoreductase [Chloroflexales bacterium]|nr:Gfo/Idh/MocA family oxidoreductase [Chloroflexales bacterium]
MSTITRPLAIGVIGTGNMGARHALNLHRYVGAARVAALCDTDPARTQAVAAQCGAPHRFDDPLQLISAAEVDAIIITSPDATHADLALACLRAGKPALCEKPLANSLAESGRVVEAELSLGRRLLTVGFMRRFDPQHRAVREVVASGELGRPLLYKGVHRNASIPSSVSGEVVLTNSAGHDFDAMRWLLGQEAAEVYVLGVRSRDSFSPETRDMLLAQIALRGDCLATIEVYVAADYGYEVSAEVVGQRGTAVTLQPDLALTRARQARGVYVPTDWLGRFQEAYVAELADWVEAAKRGSIAAGASAWDGYMALQVTDACIRSLRSGAPAAVDAPARPELYGG